MTYKVGFIIDNRLPAFSVSSMRALGPLSVLRGAPSATGMGVMRFGWVAQWLNARPAERVHYELWRPLRHYDLVVFLKSFNAACLDLAESRKRGGLASLFEINVNYFEDTGTFYYEGMKPTPDQVANATRMAGLVSSAIGASRPLCRKLAAHNEKVSWVPDNVNMDLVPPFRPRSPAKVLELSWCGQSLKLFELLAIEKPLRAFADRIRLNLVTNGLDALDAWYPPYRERFEALLRDVPHRFIDYSSIPELFSVYDTVDAALSPRFMDNSYNEGHTEWKIALAMACGCPAVCSPLESYEEVAARSAGAGIRVCRDDDAWCAAFEEFLSGPFPWNEERLAARTVIDTHYSTAVVAGLHAEAVRKVLGR